MNVSHPSPITSSSRRSDRFHVLEGEKLKGGEFGPDLLVLEVFGWVGCLDGSFEAEEDGGEGAGEGTRKEDDQSRDPAPRGCREGVTTYKRLLSE